MTQEYNPVDKWTFENEEVPLEKWIWAVSYKDGQEFIQFDRSGQFHQFKEVDIAQVTRLTMVKTEDTSKQYSIVISDDIKPFHFYRNTVLNAGLENEVRLRTYVFGYEDRRTGESMYHFILPDDRIVITRDRDFNPIKKI